MPLRTYRGAAAGPLLAQAQAELGPDAVVIRSTHANGVIELLAADPETAAAVAQLVAAPVGPAAGAPPSTPAGSWVGRPATGPSTLPTAGGAPTASPPRRNVIALVGPTGAGKTTSIAKLAAHPRLWGGRRVGLVCLDTYRVGAVEQLAAYGTALGRRVETVYEAGDVDRALRHLADCGVILVDCPGRGPRGQRESDTVSELVARLGVREVHLVLPAGLQREVAARVIDQHASRGVTHLLVTKVDEVPDDWTLFDLAAERRLPMRWLADGQRVPQDLRSAAPRLEAAQASARGRRDRRQEGAA